MSTVKTQHLTKKNVNLITKQYEPKIVQENNNELFYVFDSSFKVPKSYINVLLRYKNSPSLTKHVKNIEETFIKAYDGLLDDSQVTVELDINSYGVIIKIGGFTEMIKKVVEIFMNFYFHSADKSREEIVKEQMRDEILSKIYLSPYRKLFQGLNKLVVANYQLSEEKLIELDHDRFDCNISDFTALVNIVGNISWEDSLSIFKTITSYKKEDTTEEVKAVYPFERTIELKTNDTENNAVGFYYKVCSPKDLEDNAKSRIILQLLQERFFNQLRTIEELGYVVASNLITIPNTKSQDKEVVEKYLYFIVQSEKEPKFLIDRITRFIEESKEFISTLDESTFETYQESVIEGLKEKQKNLYDYSEYINQLFINGIKELSFKELLIKTVESVKLGDIKQFNVFSQDPLVVVAKKKDKSI